MRAGKDHIWMGPIRTIQKKICAEFEIRFFDLVSRDRSQRVVKPRHLAMWLCRRMTTASLPQIAKSFDKSDHTTVMNAIENVDYRLKKDDDFRARVEDILRSFHAAQ